MTIRSAFEDAWKTVKVGGTIIGFTISVLVFGPRAELAVAPAVNVWEIVQAEEAGGQTRWHVKINAARKCVPLVAWQIDGRPVQVKGPPMVIPAGRAMTLGPFVSDTVGNTLTASVSYNCGSPWRLHEIQKRAVIQ